MSTKRMRVFAGPNGSGKTTIFKEILRNSKVNLGVYINADEIEMQLKEYQTVDFNQFQISVSDVQLKAFFYTKHVFTSKTI